MGEKPYVCVVHVVLLTVMATTKGAFTLNESERQSDFCLSNRKFERLGGPLDEIVTVFVHKYNFIMPRPIMT